MTLIEHVTDSGALPTLASTIRFAAQRQGLLAHNIANISTPNFQQRDVSPAVFQRVMGEALDRRRRGGGGLAPRSTREIEFGGDGSVRLHPLQGHRQGVLAHDRNNRDLERLMQDLTENLGAYRVASELLRTVAGTLGVAISERVS
jgi:flagellar basal-body rod protein FlgB